MIAATMDAFKAAFVRLVRVVRVACGGGEVVEAVEAVEGEGEGEGGGGIPTNQTEKNGGVPFPVPSGW